MKRLPVLAFLLLICGLVVAGAAAQEHAQPAAPAEHRQTQSEAKPEDAGAELAEASKEAAGEDENAQFRHSPSVVWLAKVTGLKTVDAYWLSIALNFAIIAILLIMLLKSKLPGMFRARTETIRKSLDEARQSSQEARRRLSDIEARLAKLDSEIAAMQAAAEAESKAEEERIRAAAEQDAHKIIAAAEQEIAAAANLARRDLKAYVASLAVELAEKRIQVSSGADEELVRSFLERLGQDNTNHHG